MPVVSPAIGMEGAEQAVPGDHLGEPPEARHRAFLGDEEGRVDLRRRIVHGRPGPDPGADPTTARQPTHGASHPPPSRGQAWCGIMPAIGRRGRLRRCAPRRFALLTLPADRNVFLVPL